MVTTYPVRFTDRSRPRSVNDADRVVKRPMRSYFWRETRNGACVNSLVASCAQYGAVITCVFAGRVAKLGGELPPPG
jgi:hypothetical protein